MPDESELSASWPAPSRVPVRHEYEVLGAGVATRSSWGFAIAAVTMIWCVTALDTATTWVGFQRAAAWQKAAATLRPGDIEHAVDIEHRYHLLADWSLPLIIITAVFLAIWSGLVLTNARRRGVPLERTWGTALWWLMPWFGPRRAITAIATAVEAFDYSDRRLKYWLVMLYINLPLFILLYLVVGSAYVQLVDDEQLVAAVTRERMVRLLITLALVVTATLASRAVLHADRAISGKRSASPRRSA